MLIYALLMAEKLNFWC